MDFRSDNTAGFAPEILAALAAANDGPRSPYGDDEQTREVEGRLRELFETDLTACFVATGTAANALSLSLITPPWGMVYCHEQAHVAVDECGAPEFYTGGAKLALLPGAHGRLEARQLAALLPGGLGVVHHAQPAAVSLSQATEAGTCYRPSDIAAIAEVAQAHGLHLHMDGARFANAVAFLGASPAELSWRSGIDVLSFGASKNGALAAEALLVFDPALAASLRFRRKRAGHQFAKMRVLSAQLDAYLREDLWLRLASRANAHALHLATGLAGIPGVRLCHPVEANEVFVELPDAAIRALEAEGFRFYRWPEDRSARLRLVTSFETHEAHVLALIEATRRIMAHHARGAAPAATR